MRNVGPGVNVVMTTEHAHTPTHIILSRVSKINGDKFSNRISPVVSDRPIRKQQQEMSKRPNSVTTLLTSVLCIHSQLSGVPAS